MKDKKTGRTVMTRLGSEQLQGFTDLSQGLYIEGSTRPDLGMSEVEAMVGTLEKRDLKARVRTFFVDRYTWPLGFAFFLWVIAIAWPMTRRSKHGAQPIASLVLLLCLGWHASVDAKGPAGSEESIFTRDDPYMAAGAKALVDGESEKAIEYFRSAKPKTKAQRAVKAYNEGTALLYKGATDQAAAAQAAAEQGAQGTPPSAAPSSPPPTNPTAPSDDEEEVPAANIWQDAERAFTQAYGLTKNPLLRSEAALGIGNAKAMSQDLEGAIDAYRDSLVANPQNERARENLLMALKALRAQPPQENQDGENEENEDGDEKEEKEDQEKGENDQGEDEKDKEEKKGQQDPQEKDEKEESKPSSGKDEPEQKDGKQQQPPQAQPLTEEEMDKETAKQLLDALRQQENPLAPFIMRQLRQRPVPEKDW